MDPETPNLQLLPFLRAYWNLSRAQHRRLAIAGLIIFVMQACSALTPVLMTDLLIRASRRGLEAWPKTAAECLALLGLYTFVGWIEIPKSQRVRQAAAEMQHTLRSRLLRRLLAFDGTFFETNNVTGLYGDLSRGIARIGDLTFLAGHDLVPLLFLTLTTACAISWYDRLYLAILAPATITYIGVTVWVRASTAVSRFRRHQLDRGTDRLIGGALANARTVCAYNQQENEIHRVEERQAAGAAMLYAEYRGYDRLKLWRHAWVGAACIACLGVCLWRIRHAPPAGQARLLAEGLGALILTERLFRACSGIIDIFDKFAEGSAAAQYVFALLSQEPTITDPEDPVRLTDVRGALCLQDAWYAYPSAPTVAALAGINLSIRAGEIIGLVGASGGGKSTLVKALLRLIELQKGHVLLDGIDIRRLTLHDLRATIGYVAQETDLFDRTAAENIAYGRPDATRDEIIAAARQAHAHGFIEALPQGYDTRIGDRGARLSGGQRQRLGIARALLCQTPVILLDEATANVDVEGDASIHEAIADLARAGRTIIVIAHRLATVQNVDRIVCMEKGRIVEIGTPAELARANGPYARLKRAHERFERGLPASN